MRKIFTLLATVMLSCCIAVAQQISVTWDPVTSLTPDVKVNGVSESDSELASDMAIMNPEILRQNGQQDITLSDGSKLSLARFGLKTSQTAGDGGVAPEGTDRCLKCPISVPAGKKLSITKVSFYTGKSGSGDPMYIDAYLYGNNIATYLQKTIDLPRLEKDFNAAAYSLMSYTAQSVADLDETTFTEDVELRFCVYSGSKAVSNTKYWDFAQIKIEGELSDASSTDNRTYAPISWDPETVTLTTQDEFTSPVLKNDEGLSITYSSNNTSLATVADGVISLIENEVGTAEIYAEFAGNDTYKPTTKVCTITVNLAKETKVGAKTLAVNLEGDVTANTTVFEDELITVVNTESTKAAVAKVNICGADFTNYVNVRVAGIDNGQFTPQTDNSPLKLTPAADMELIVYGRIQNKTSNPDLKDIKNCDLYDAALDKVVSTGIYFSEWIQDKDNPYAYAYVAQTYDLKADQTYYLAAQGFGFRFSGLGYTPVISEDVAQLIEDLKALIAEAEETDWNSNTETTALALVDAIIEAKKALSFTTAEAIEEVKANLEQAMENLEPQEFEYTTAHTWDFTQWTNETVANLRLDAANSKLSGWSDVEKIKDAQDDKEPADATKNNCFWLTANDQTDAEGYLQANGKTITELYGLKVTGELLTSRNLAIAVNYPEALSKYEGPKYLWIGGQNKTIVIPGVKLGSTITMGVESHNTGSKRGVDLYINGTDTKLEGPAEYPTTYEEQTWTVPTEVPAGVADDETAQSVDILVKNNDGCHVYYIDAAVEQGPTTAITEVKAEETDAPVVYYNLQGVRVDNPAAGLYIRKQGNNVSKVIIK